MKRTEIKVGMLLHAWTSLWGEHIIKVKEVTAEKPARVKGTIVKTLKEGDGFRAGRLTVGKEMEVGIVSVKIPTASQLENCNA